MGKLYKVGEYGEMKLGEFRKNIMQYTRNNLRSIIASSDPEIVEIAIDELTRRGEELKEGKKGILSPSEAKNIQDFFSKISTVKKFIQILPKENDPAR